MSRPSSSRRKLVSNIGFVFFLVLLVEAETRLCLAYALPEPVIPLGLVRSDPDLGWWLEPGARGSSSATGQLVEYSINAQGLRDAEYSYEKPEGRFRIVLLGDSGTFGHGVPIEKHFSYLLEGYWGNVEVINMGVGGFGIDQELLLLRKEGLRYGPDLVICYVPHYAAHRHMHNERWGSRKPRFRREGTQLVLEKIEESEFPSVSRYNPISRLLLRYSRLAVLLHLYSLSWSDNQITQDRQDQNNLQEASFELELYALGEAIVTEMAAASEANQARFVLVTCVPRLYQACLRKGILALDVSEALANPNLHIPGDGHLNEFGSGVLAWQIRRFLVERELIP